MEIRTTWVERWEKYAKKMQWQKTPAPPPWTISIVKTKTLENQVRVMGIGGKLES